MWVRVATFSRVDLPFTLLFNARGRLFHPGQEAVPVNLQAFHDGEILSPLSFRFGGIGCSFSAVAYKPSLSCILSVQWPISPHCRPTPEKGHPLHIVKLFFQCSGLSALTAGRPQRRGIPSISGFCLPLRWRPRRIGFWGRILYGPLLPA